MFQHSTVSLLATAFINATEGCCPDSLLSESQRYGQITPARYLIRSIFAMPLDVAAPCLLTYDALLRDRDSNCDARVIVYIAGTLAI
jgi:hypothetical protein